MEIGARIEIQVKYSTGKASGGRSYELYKDEEMFKEGRTDNEGFIKYEDLIPGRYRVLLKTEVYRGKQ